MVRLTDNTPSDEKPQISGLNVTWEQRLETDGFGNTEILVAYVPEPEGWRMVIAGAALLCMLKRSQAGERRLPSQKLRLLLVELSLGQHTALAKLVEPVEFVSDQ